MPTRDINEYLESGETDAINLQDVTPDDAVLTKGETTTLIESITDPIDIRVTRLEEGHEIVLNAICGAVSQEPTGLGVPLQVTYGGAQGGPSDPVQVDALGNILFNEAEKYIINFRAHYGRTGASGTSILMFRFLKNGVQQGNSFATKIADGEILVPWDSSSFVFDAEVGDILTSQIIRDSAGANAGGLFEQLSTDGWAGAPCSAVTIYKV